MRIGIICDNHPSSGKGHWTRCQRLIRALAGSFDVHLFPEDHPDSSVPIRWTFLKSFDPDGFDWIIVDHYHWNYLPASETRWLILDDTGTRQPRNDREFIWDSTPGLERSDQGPQIWAGNATALFPAIATPISPASPETDYLVTLGATPQPILLQEILVTIQKARPQASITAISPTPLRTPTGVEQLPLIPGGIDDLLASSRFVICAGGQTAIEAVAAGHRPGLIPVADNQKRLCQAWHQKGWAVLLGLHPQVNDILNLTPRSSPPPEFHSSSLSWLIQNLKSIAARV